ncbi:hypothetical protein FRC03_012415 [Tulasnella sp. 419]|nr:hypothetical protein FRC03_012415 [Tulasnella sp. 419]
MAINASQYSQPTTEANLRDGQLPTPHPPPRDNNALPFQLPRSTNYDIPQNSSLPSRRESWHPNDLARSRKDSGGDGPFAFTPQLLETSDYIGDYQGRRWSYSSNALPQANQNSHLNRPWTSANPQSSYYGASSSSTLSTPSLAPPFPLHYGANSHFQPQPTPPTTSSSTSSYDRPSSSSYSSSRPSTTASIVSVSSSSSFPSIQTPLSNFDSFYGLDTKTRGSTDTIVDASHAALQSSADDSNPFFFQRQLQNLQMESPPRINHSAVHSQYRNQQTAQSLSVPQSDSYQFYDYSTPPSTANSTASNQFFDSLTSLPLPPSTSPSASGPVLQAQQAASASSYSNNIYASSRTSNNAPGTPSPYSLIVPNPDPSSAASRPHLCTHCNETFRRIHDAKRHAYGALGIKNYACMGGCGMSFKRSEGRARHWMREEVAGVGPPGRIWGGKGCEERHARMMSGTMEEDRRLRNKARRERILMMNTRHQVSQNNSASSTTSSGNTASPPQSSQQSSPLESSGPGPIRHNRSGIMAAGAPY